MAPFTFTPLQTTLITLAIGFAFGFVLERAGFGNARNLAAQFYLYDMRVLKVMFTAIVTAMLLVYLAVALGLLEFQRVWIPPTYVWPGVLGGFLLGVGFIIGGYCPGTSLVAASTLKIDGLDYVGGVLLGLFLFGETVPIFWNFFNAAGAFGRVTLFQLLGVDAGWVVLGVVVMAVGAFAFAEFVERLFARPGQPQPSLSSQTRSLRRLAVATAGGLALATLLVGQPSVERKMAWASAGLEQSIRDRKIHVDPAELLTLMYNNQVPLALLDVRSVADYNVFHLRDARRVDLDQLTPAFASQLPGDAVVIVMSNDERAAHEAWKRLAVELNSQWLAPVANRSRVYVLAGGVNRWLDIYLRGDAQSPGTDVAASGEDRLRHSFSAALGDRTPAARPDVHKAPHRDFVTKVQAAKPKRVAGGGCG